MLHRPISSLLYLPVKVVVTASSFINFGKLDIFLIIVLCLLLLLDALKCHTSTIKLSLTIPAFNGLK